MILDSLRKALEAVAGLDGEGLEGMYPPPAAKPLDNDPLQGQGHGPSGRNLPAPGLAW
jgi:hypothetical protein